MRAGLATAAGEPLSLTELDVPEPGPGEVLVKMIACGVCFTDLGLLQGHYPFARFPVVPGHEVTGTVVATGPGVTWPTEGTVVGAQFLNDSCGHCEYCRRGDQILCREKKITGIVVDGGYAEYAVFKAGFVTELPAGLDPVAGAPLMCAGITAFNGLRQAGAVPGSKVAVIGTGGVGALAIRYAAAIGARVAAIGRSRHGEDRAKQLGAEIFVATEEGDPGEALQRWAQGADVILSAAPSTAAAQATFGGLAPDGTLVLCGYGPEPLTLPTSPMVLNRLHAMANPSGSPHDLRDTLEFSVAQGILPEFRPITLDEAPATLDAMAQGHGGVRSVITFT